MFPRSFLEAVCIAGLLFTPLLHAQDVVSIPNSSLSDPSDLHKVTTPLRVLKLNTKGRPTADGVPSVGSAPDPGAETPASVACFYGITTQVPGCPIAGTTALPTGSPSSIAVVDAYNDPNAASDLTTFSNQFGLPSANLSIYPGTPGGTPGADPTGGGWNLETSLDLQWAHALNPQASLMLIQANSASDADLCQAVKTAYQLGAKFINLSLMAPANDTSWDSCLSLNTQTSPPTGPVYIASAGDSTLSVHYPAASPSVIAAGGTRFVRNGTSLSEIFWDDGTGEGGGGGVASTESRPATQNPVQNVVGSQRGIPDFAAIAYGVTIYDSNLYNGSIAGWTTVEGTSISAPVIAGRLSALGTYGLGSQSALTPLYATYGTAAYSQLFRDVIGNDSPCVSGYDLCTGLGTMIGNPTGATATGSLYFNDFYVKGQTVTTQTQNITVTNRANSSGSLTVTGVSIAASSGPDIYSVASNNCTGSVAPGSSCTIAIKRNYFTGIPNGTAETFAATVTIATNGVNTPQITLLSCTGHG